MTTFHVVSGSDVLESSRQRRLDPLKYAGSEPVPTAPLMHAWSIEVTDAGRKMAEGARQELVVAGEASCPPETYIG